MAITKPASNGKVQSVNGRERELLDLIAGAHKSDLSRDSPLHKLLTLVIHNPADALFVAYNDEALKMTYLNYSIAWHAAYHAEASLVMLEKPEIMVLNGVAHRVAKHEGAAQILASDKAHEQILKLYSQTQTPAYAPDYKAVAHVIAENYPELAWENFKNRPHILNLKNGMGTAVLSIIEVAARNPHIGNEVIAAEIAAFKVSKRA
ncbi:MAG: hypothetical protein KGH64_03875 [Candidatus Micrarchaeota archaeon]|nr:hypothetical protein [Candidatus Micrarchaeota archaeon]MDE1834449.1 hypothetical protein [Candidatus Micrarchaeota archaeon]MDE1859490.1 hypothetical protein [Candidatus Micrarchaeota archaeon]